MRVLTGPARAYYNWLLDIVAKDPFKRRAYSQLLRTLFDRPFRFDIPRDGNRAQAGLQLRESFEEHRLGQCDILRDELMHECSLLEMFVALAGACEDRIMFDPEFGDRTPKWFWDMLDNMGLTRYPDHKYDARAVNDILDRFERRKYRRDGYGGPFPLHNPDPDIDMRNTELWYQLNYWLLDRYGDEI